MNQEESSSQTSTQTSPLIKSIGNTTCVVIVAYLAVWIVKENFWSVLLELAPQHHNSIVFGMVLGSVVVACIAISRRGIGEMLTVFLIGAIVFALGVCAVIPRLQSSLEAHEYQSILYAAVALGIQAGVVLSFMATSTSILLSLLYDKLIALTETRQLLFAAIYSCLVVGVVLWQPLVVIGERLFTQWSNKPSIDLSYQLMPSNWKGKIRSGATSYAFTLVIQEVGSNGTFSGYMDWGPSLRLKVEGIARGNHLQFVDTAFLVGRGNAALGDKKEVWITGDRMVGTDKDGMVPLEAHRLTGQAGSPGVFVRKEVQEKKAQPPISSAAPSPGSTRVASPDTGSSNPLGKPESFHLVRFLDRKTGWVSGALQVFGTHNGGASWKIDRSITTYGIANLAFVNDTTGYALGSGTIMKTVDRGVTWTTQYKMKVKSSGLYGLSFIDENTGWVVGGHGVVLATNNGGTTWSRQNSETNVHLRSVSFVDTRHGWAVGDRGKIILTNDGGETWQEQICAQCADLRATQFLNRTTGFIVGYRGAILKTTDGGATWAWSRQINTNRPSSDLHDVTFLNPSVGWVVGKSGTILSTLDGGLTWNAQQSGVKVELNSVHFIDPLHGWVVGSRWKHEEPGVILQTVNGGKTWKNVTKTYSPPALAAGPQQTLLDVDFVDSQIGWAVGNAGTILATKDGGQHWRNQVSGTIHAIKGVTFLNAEVGWAVGEKGLVLKTVDGGSSWNVQPTGVRADLNAVYFMNVNHGLVAGRSGTILSTRDGGKSWKVVPTETSQDFYAMTFADSTTGWASGSAYGLNNGIIRKTEDGGETWIRQNSRTRNSLRGMAFLDAQTGWVVATNGIILKTEDGGANWVRANWPGRRGTFYGAAFVNRNTGWVVGDHGAILKTEDGGQSWAVQASKTRQRLFSADFVNSHIGWAVGGKGTILFTNDGGTTWNHQNQSQNESQKGMSGNVLGGHLVRVKFLNSKMGWLVGGGVVGMTNDGGITWTAQSLGRHHSFEDVAFSSPSVGWIAGRDGIMKTPDGGQSWQDTWGGSSYGVVFVDDRTGWAFGSLGTIVKTTDAGLTWTRQMSGTKETLFHASFVDSRNGWVVSQGGTILATSNGGEQWTPQKSGTRAWLMDVKFLNHRQGWVVGNGGTVLSTTDGGVTWVKQESGTTETLTSVAFVSSSMGWVAGSNGTILKTIDGGRRWTTQPAPTCQLLRSLAFQDEWTGMAVGNYGTMLRTKNGGRTWVDQSTAASKKYRKQIRADARCCSATIRIAG